METRERLETAVRLAASAEVNPAGEFEILAITAGLGNGWDFTPEALRASLALWQGAQCFVDHGLGLRSIRDLAGVLESVVWDERVEGIRGRLAASGPSGSLLEDLGRRYLSAPEASRPRIGFSADLVFQADGKKVVKITRVNSLDLVYHPARGGVFVRSLNSDAEDSMLEEKGTVLVEPQHSVDLEAARELLQATQEKEKLAKEAESAQAFRAQMCTYLLESGLAAARLPAAMVEHIRLQFKGRVFEASELNGAIETARTLLGQLQAASVVQGPGRISGMFNTGDQLRAAVDDLFEVPREKGSENLKVARLSGIRELYLTLTGDIDLHGGYDASRVQLATTADFSGLVKNALNKIVINTWDSMGQAGYNWWETVVTKEHFETLNDVSGILVGTVGDLPLVAEGAEYTELMVGDSPETASFKKYGGYVPLTLELIDRDNTRKLKAYAKELGNAGMRKISSLVAGIFTQAAGVGPTLADGGALFNATAVTTAGGHANLLTTALSAAQWEVIGQAVYNQPTLIRNSAGAYGTGPKLGINPKYCLVPRALMLTAKQILYPSMERASSIFTENMQQGQPGDVVVVPDWTDATDFAAVCDPRILPAVYVGERFGIKPEIFIAGDNLSPAVFMNDESRLKVRHFLAVWVNDFRPLHKSNVAG